MLLTVFIFLAYLAVASSTFSPRQHLKTLQTLHVSPSSERVQNRNSNVDNNFDIVGSSFPKSAFSTSKSLMPRNVRMEFMQKVYLILFAQVLATVLITGSLFKFPALLYFFYRHSRTIGLLSALTSYGSNLVLFRSPRLRHTFPSNALLLLISTVSQAVPVAVFSTFFDPLSVCLGSMHSLTIFMALTIFAWQPNPKWDLSMYGQWLLGACISLIVVVPLLAAVGLPLETNLLSSLTAILFSVFIVYDTQKILGKSNRGITPDEPILAALVLYQDMLGLFVELLKLVDNSHKSRNQHHQRK
jgi:hypothetical protein